ncbi:hypothetical protein [Indioceanicola profundi]|nr:hypothetical protein [Indioceanicola profundi]
MTARRTQSKAIAARASARQDAILSLGLSASLALALAAGLGLTLRLIGP